jgi:folylpolyglutamate synthase/dihydropteroate synthase
MPWEYQDVEAAIRARGVEWEIEPSLDRIRGLTDLLGSPQHTYAVIHVTGTNGKTSTAHMIDALLRGRGLRTGRYTSPHLTSMRERICVDGEPISEGRFADVYAEVLPYLRLVDSQSPVPLSFFEVLTAMAFAAFADTPVDVAVVEVGMGGIWDATNVADGRVAVVTPISLDHTAYLGDSIESIATEKAGIIKPGAVAVLAQQPIEAAEVLLRQAAQTGASVAREGIEFGVLQRDVAVGGQHLVLRGLRGVYEEIFLPLFGAHQAGNAACALAAVEAFAGVPGSAAEPDAEPGAGTGAGIGTAGDAGGPLDPSLVRESFAQITSPGRLEVVRRSPTVIVDAAHNPAGMAAAVAGVEESFGFAEIVGVVAMSADKDVVGMLEQLEPALSEIVVTRNSSARSMDVPALAELAGDVFGPERVRTAARLDDAIDIAVGLADEAEAGGLPGEIVPGGAGVLIIGSVVTAGDARLLLTSSAGGTARRDGTG